MAKSGFVNFIDQKGVEVRLGSEVVVVDRGATFTAFVHSIGSKFLIVQGPRGKRYKFPLDGMGFEDRDYFAQASIFSSTLAYEEYTERQKIIREVESMFREVLNGSILEKLDYSKVVEIHKIMLRNRRPESNILDCWR